MPGGAFFMCSLPLTLEPGYATGATQYHPQKIGIYSNISQNSHLFKFFYQFKKVHQPRAMYYRTRSSDVYSMNEHCDYKSGQGEYKRDHGEYKRDHGEYNNKVQYPNKLNGLYIQTTDKRQKNTMSMCK